MKEKESPRKSVSKLLDQLIASEELGKWTAFLDALSAAGKLKTNFLITKP